MRLANLLSAGLVASLALAVHMAPVAAQETGGVKGIFTLNGEIPDLPAPVVDKDTQVCGKTPVPNQTIVVDPETKGLANVFIWIRRFDKNDIPESLKQPSEEKVVLDQKNCVFIPHCLIVRAGQSLVALNDDPVSHNVRATLLRNGTFNDSIAPNDREGITREMTRGEILPQPIQCDIHPWMQAHMLVVDHPYADLSDEKGAFTIEGLPEGKYDFTVWQETTGYIRNIDALEDVEIKAGETIDLGKIGVTLR